VLRTCLAFVFCCGLPSLAQIVPASSTTVLDYAGGQGTWAGSGQIVEEYPVAAKSDGSELFGMGLLQVGPPPSRTTISTGLYPTIVTPACSVGNPSSDGNNVVFLVQSNAIDATGTPNCTPGATLADQAPKNGLGYGIGACEGPMTPTFTMSSANCRVILPLTSGEVDVYAGYLDPVLIGNDLFIAHRIHGAVSGFTSTIWQIAHFSIDFTTLPYPSNLQLVNGLQPGTWPDNYVTNNCEQYYKPTSASKDVNGQWTVYTQADQVSYSAFPVNSPGNNGLDGGSVACVGLGATWTQSGLYSYNESNPATTWTQIWPQPGTTLITAPPNDNSKGYAEFPELFVYGNTTYLLFISQTASTDAAVNDCVALTTPVPCLPNYDNEMVILNTASGTAATITNLFNPPSALNTVYFPGDPQTGFGGTARLNVSPDAQSFIFNLEDGTGRHWLVQFPLFYAGTPVVGLPSSVQLTATPNPAQFGTAISLTATVSTAGATGSVTFYNGVSVLGTAALANGQAVFTTSLLPAGTDSLTARYDGNYSIAPSTSNVFAETVTAVAGGAFNAPQTVSSANAAAVAVGDFNGDGVADLAIAPSAGNELNVLLGMGSGTFSSPAVYGAVLPGASIWNSVAVGDFNGDGKPDIVVGLAGENAVSVFLGNGDGTFQAGVHFPVAAPPYAVIVADFNGDGIPDIATANAGSSDVSILLGNGDGTFQTALSYTALGGSASLVAGDVNGDGHPDLAVCGPGSSNVSVLLGKGDGTFQAPVLYPIGVSGSQLATADFNGDGNLDLAVVSSSASTFAVLLGAGGGTFQSVVNYPVDGGSLSLAISDFNGDGKPDVAVAGAALNTYLGSGNGSFEAAGSYPLGSNPGAPASLAAADFNQDGRPDLVLAAPGLNGLTIALATAAAPCTFSVSPTSFTYDASGGVATVQVTASDATCAWTALPSASWLSATPTAGAGSSPLQITVAPNNTGAARSGTVSIGGQTVSFLEDFTTQIFSDVVPTDYYFDAVDLMATYGITSGCGNGDYCPEEDVTRADMAIFIVRTVYGGDNFTYQPTPYFADVPANAFGFAWIQKLFELGITTGCGGDDFCPNDNVTRAEMAIFIIRARYGENTIFGYNPIPIFNDVPTTYFAFEWIQRLAMDSITTGCGPALFCPESPVIRADMAIFIMRGGFNLLLPTGTPVISQVTPGTLAPGASGVFTVTGLNTNFVQGVTGVVPTGGISASDINMVSPTQFTVTLTAASNALLQPEPVYVETGTQVAILPNAIHVQ